MLTSLQALLRLATLRWLGVFICALATLLATTSTASALEPAQTKTRVWGFDFADNNSAGLFLAVSPRTHLENRSSSAEAVSGSLLAARGTGAFLAGAGAEAGAGFGKLAGRSIQVSEKGLALVEGHLARFGPSVENAAMIDRLRAALSSGSRIAGADAVFYLHEASEATMMARGLIYDVAHAGALAKYGVSPFSVYAREVVAASPHFSTSPGWVRFWGL